VASKIALVMPCYDGLKYIRQAIDSVLSQSLQDWELLVSDDGSKDGTVQYIESLCDERIKVFIQPKNLGIFGNLNFLFARVDSPITQILCQDDFLIGPDALEKILAIWSELPAAIAFLRCNHRLDGSSRMMRLEEEMLPPIIEPKTSDLYFFIFGCLPGNLSNVSVRTPVVAEMGWYRTDLPYAGDFEFWSRTGRAHPWALSQAQVVQVRGHAEQASKTLNRKGELLPQLRLVIVGLSERLRAQGYSPSDLRWFASTVYVAQHMYGGIRRAMRGGGWGYLKLVTKLFTGSECFLGKGATWVAFFMSVGGRFLGPTMARRLVGARGVTFRS
jgi:glycosyltransferase involved in cell wall biosynthesis